MESGSPLRFDIRKKASRHRDIEGEKKAHRAPGGSPGFFVEQAGSLVRSVAPAADYVLGGSRPSVVHSSANELRKRGGRRARMSSRVSGRPKKSPRFSGSRA